MRRLAREFFGWQRVRGGSIESHNERSTTTRDRGARETRTQDTTQSERPTGAARKTVIW
jgi:hypothetical protein